MSRKILFKVYNKVFVSLVSSILFLILIFNLIIDVYGDFNLIQLPINLEKVYASLDGGRRKKANYLRQHPNSYETIILGSSRALWGINPHNKFLYPLKTYNLALQGASIYEIKNSYLYAKTKQNLHQVILSLDLISFTHKVLGNGDFYISRFDPKVNNLQILVSYLSLKNFFLSLKTILRNHQQITEQKLYGFQDLDGYEKKAQNYLKHIRLSFNKTLKHYINQKYHNFSYGLEEIEFFREIVADCLSNNINIILFISPVHALQLEAIAVSNLEETFEQWKRDLVKVIETEAIKYNKPVPLLWDFSGYNSITTEAIPLSQNELKMRWYLESSHYTEELGDLMTKIMLNYPKLNLEAPSDFGTILVQENIEDSLQNIRRQREYYRQQYPQEIQLINYLAGK